MQEIRLNEYRAQINDPQLSLGTWDSYGVEKLKVIPGIGWEGLAITATFVTPVGSTRVLVPQDGLLPVPPEATAHPLASGTQGQIVFAGVADGIQRISTNVLYIVSDHAPVEGEDSHPTPSEFAQFVAQVQDAASNAEKSAAEAAVSASAVSGSAEQAKRHAEDAENSAQDAVAALEEVQAAVPAALQSIDAARTTAVDAVQQARQTAAQAVEQAGTEQADKVTRAGDAKLAQIEAANAILPNPSEADAGKAVVVNPDGNGYELGTAPGSGDGYTKAECDDRYVPIEAAIKVSGSGTGLVSLPHTIAWQPQMLRIYGRTWQGGTPSEETPAPLASAGDGGTVDVTVCGANLCPDFEAASTAYNSILPIASYRQVYDAFSKAIRPGNQYRISATVLHDGAEYDGDFTIGIAYKGGAFITIYGNKATGISSGVADEINYIYLYSGPNVDDRKTRIVKNVMLIAGTENTPDYKPYQPQQLPISTPDGLPGIPVDSGGNWTDEAGQRWISDVIDLGAEIKTQCCGQITSYNGETITTPYISSTGTLTAGAQVIYALPEPITTPLDAETVAAYHTLITCPGTTNVMAPDAGIEASALGNGTQIIADIEKKISGAVTSAVALAQGGTI